ncbi:MAG: hypothetical protein M0Z51_16695 [Propionibacterium sp.]|nr:hypothetical protein [Propionibacterium sp.]
MARSLAAAQTRTADSEYREIIGWYEDQLQRAAPPTDLLWEPVKVGPTWQYENGWVLPALSLGWRNLAWSGMRLRGKGGKPWAYTLEQARFLLWFWALDESGEFLYHSAVLQRLKGWGKDPLGACVAATDVCSEDAAFDHFDGDVPMGRPQENAWVQVVAVSQVQTQNTMKLFPSLFSDPDTRREYGIQVGKLNVWAKGDAAQIEAVTSSWLAIEGGRPTLIIRNEPQNWLSSNGGHEMAGAIEGNAAKSEIGSPARMLDIENAYRPGQDSVAQRVRESWEKTQGTHCEAHRGEAGWPPCINCQPPASMDFGLLYDSLEAPPEAPLTAEAAPEVVRSIAGDSTWLDTKPNGRIVKSIINGSNSASESRRKWYNQISAAEDAWADPNDVRKASRPDRIAAGEAVVLFGDGSKSGDATGLVATRISDGHTQVLHVQQPKAGQIVDREAYDLAVVEAVATFKVQAFWFDPSHAKDDESEGDARFWWPLCDTWSTRYGRRLKCWPVKTGPRTHAVAFDMALGINQALFVPACEQVAGELVSGVVTFTESAWLHEHLVNAKLAPTKYGVSVRKENRSSRRKIDLAVCLIGGRMLRRIYLLSTKQGTPGKGRAILLD